MKNIEIIEKKEIKEGMRKRWVMEKKIMMEEIEIRMKFIGREKKGRYVEERKIDVVIVRI